MAEQSAFTQNVVETVNPQGSGGFVLVCEHASAFIPEYLDDLGLSEEESRLHIAWDPGAVNVARAMSVILDAPLVATRVSRLVYDCNREEGAPDAAVATSDGIEIPGNTGLAKADIAARARAVYQPFSSALDACLEKYCNQGRAVSLVTIHSFTPVFGGGKRNLEIGVLHDRDSRLADEMLDIAQSSGYSNIRRNAPYGPQDGVTHTLKKHALTRAIPNAMLEIRNDLIADDLRQHDMAVRLSSWIVEANSRLDVNPAKNILQAGG